MTITDLATQPETIHHQAAHLLVHAFDHPSGWPNLDAATTELHHVIHNGFALANLYDDIPRHITELRDLGTRHPFLFYRRLGYVVTGIVPDANGPGKPDIYMSKPARSSSDSVPNP